MTVCFSLVLFFNLWRMFWSSFVWTLSELKSILCCLVSHPVYHFITCKQHVFMEISTTTDSYVIQNVIVGN